MQIYMYRYAWISPDFHTIKCYLKEGSRRINWTCINLPKLYFWLKLLYYYTGISFSVTWAMIASVKISKYSQILFHADIALKRNWYIRSCLFRIIYSKHRVRFILGFSYTYFFSFCQYYLDDPLRRKFVSCLLTHPWSIKNVKILSSKVSYEEIFNQSSPALNIWQEKYASFYPFVQYYCKPNNCQ